MASSNSDLHDISLIQGAQLAHQKNALNENDPNYLLQNTSDPESGSIREDLHDPKSVISRSLPGSGSTPMVPLSNHFLATAPSDKSNPISGMQDKFNKLLANYTTDYKQMTHELMINNTRPELQNFAGKNIKHENNFYHVNNFGFGQVYDNKAWKDRSDSCASSPINITSDEFGNLLTGPNMGNGQACNVAGYNIHNKKSGEQSWVDIKGVRHVYPNDTWDKRSASCQGTPRSLSEAEYQGIPEGTKMDSNTLCNKLNVNPAIIKNLAKLNAELLTLGNQLIAHTTSMTGSDEHIQSEITKAHNSMVATLKRLNGDKHQLKKSMTNMGNTGVQLNNADLTNNIQGAKRNSELFLTMNYMKYVTSFIFVILLVLYSFASFPSSKQSTISSIILVLVILVALFHFWTFISGKLF